MLMIPKYYPKMIDYLTSKLKVTKLGPCIEIYNFHHKNKNVEVNFVYGNNIDSYFLF